MKTTERLFFATLSAVFILFILAGCIKDRFPQDGLGGSVPVLMSIGTRADIEDEEVVSLRVYAYSAGKLVGEYYTDSPAFVSGKATLLMDIKQVSASPQRTAFYLIANEAAASGLADGSGAPVSFTEAPSESYLKGLNYAGISGHIPMSGTQTAEINLDATSQNAASGHSGHQMSTQKIELTLARSVSRLEFLFSRSPGNDLPITVKRIEYAAGTKAASGWLFRKTAAELKTALASKDGWTATAEAVFQGELPVEINTSAPGSHDVSEYVFAGSGIYSNENPYGSATPDEGDSDVKDAGGVVRGTNFKITYSIGNETVEKTVWLPVLERNKIYRVFCEIDRLSVAGFYTVLDWDEVGISISAPEVTFLQVSKTLVEMRNVASDNSVVFNSSSDVTVTVLKSWFINKFGQEIPVSTVSASASGSSGRIAINSPVPTNNIALHSTLEVRNADGMTRTVNIIQYPLDRISFEVGWYSYRSDFIHSSYSKAVNFESPGDTSNCADRLTLYTSATRTQSGWTYGSRGSGDFTSKVKSDNADSSGDYTIYNYYYSEQGSGWNQRPPYSYTLRQSAVSTLTNPRIYHVQITSTSDKYVLGIPGKDSDGKTLPDDYTRNMVSPSFMLASQLGAVQTSIANSASDAAYHCSQYVEKTVDGTVYDDWRLPTEAELLIIKMYQNTSTDAMAEVLTGDRYWSASGAVRINSTGNDTYLRCIRDAF